MNTTTALLPIGNLLSGQLAVIEEVDSTEEECHRLAALGFSAGTLVRMLMPGSPCAVQVGEGRVMLRGAQLQSILVTIL